jgi:hypothetical protein
MSRKNGPNSDLNDSKSEGLDRRSLCKGLLGIVSAVAVPTTAFAETAVPVGIVWPPHDDHTDQVKHIDYSHLDSHNDVHYDNDGDLGHVDHHSDHHPRPAHFDEGKDDAPHHLDHGDAMHQDHADIHLDDHGDASVPGIAHGDHWLPPHADHVDMSHTDILHSDSDHFDSGDPNHTDLHTDVNEPHTDGPDHTDFHYDWHTDVDDPAHHDHTDVPHFDTPPHSDHTDHSDHGDAPHFDILNPVAL